MKLKTLVLIAILMAYHSIFGQAKNGWTIMHYAVGSNSSEIDLLSDIDEMMRGKTSEGYELITLIDRTEGHSEDATTLGENFTDTRLYRLHNNSYQELDGGEFLPGITTDAIEDLNMADANELKNFIRYCKKMYPAKHYMLVLRSHGNGIGMCPDAESGVRDKLYPGELREVLTEEESVDIFGLDVCSMAGLENFYEWRKEGDSFYADYILASAPLSTAWAYDDLFQRLTTTQSKSDESNYFGGGQEENLNPYTMTPLQFSELIIEEIYDSQTWASWSLVDNREIGNAKRMIDELARLLANEEKSKIIGLIEGTLGYHHNTNSDLEVALLGFPYVDAYQFFKGVSTAQVASAAKSKALEVCQSLDALVIESYYGEGYLPTVNDFAEGQNGVYLILPVGNRIFSQTKRSFWAHTTWYHPDDRSHVDNSYGLYDWCSDGGVRENRKVDNFFELLDYLFDDSNDSKGGVNGYQW